MAGKAPSLHSGRSVLIPVPIEQVVSSVRSYKRPKGKIGDDIISKHRKIKHLSLHKCSVIHCLTRRLPTVHTATAPVVLRLPALRSPPVRSCILGPTPPHGPARFAIATFSRLTPHFRETSCRMSLGSCNGNRSHPPNVESTYTSSRCFARTNLTSPALKSPDPVPGLDSVGTQTRALLRFAQKANKSRKLHWDANKKEITWRVSASFATISAGTYRKVFTSFSALLLHRRLQSWPRR